MACSDDGSTGTYTWTWLATKARWHFSSPCGVVETKAGTTVFVTVSLKRQERMELRRPPCVLCCPVLSDACLKPSKMSKHFPKRNGGDLDNRSRIRTDRRGILETLELLLREKSLLETSCHAAHLCAKKTKPCKAARNF